MADRDLAGKERVRPRPASRNAPGSLRQESAQAAEPTAVLVQRAVEAPGTLRPAEGRRLQGVLGNRGLSRLVQARPRIQARLSVGAAHDAYEQEADRMAERALDARPQGSEPIRRVPETAQRSASAGEGGFETGPAFERQLARSSGGGRPLPEALREQVEPTYGASFEDVRVHSGPESAGLAESIQAKAFTHGSDIHFNAGEYDPNSSVGQRLIAHELTHVVQQGAAVQRKPVEQEQEAERGIAVQRSPDGVIQRTGKRVNSLIAFWESQKIANAPKAPAPKPGGGEQEAEPQPVGPGNPELLQEALEPSEHKYDQASESGSQHYQMALNAPMFGGGGFSPQYSESESDSGRSDSTPQTASESESASKSGSKHYQMGVNLAALGGGAFSPQYSESESDSGVSDSTPQSASETASAGGALPLGMQFPGQTKYKDRLEVDQEYKDERTDSSHFLFTKVFQVSSEAAFFSKYDENRRKLILKSIGWSDEDIAELEATKKTKVKYIDSEEERAEYRLQLGATIKQGSSADPFDTSAMFANGVGNGHAIFVMDPNGVFYAGRHKIAVFHHSTFLGGAPAAAAGTLQIIGGQLRSVTAKSGHYQPKPRQLRLALAELKSHGVSLSNVKIRTMNEMNFQLNPEEPAEDFLNQGITPDLAPQALVSSSPLTASTGISSAPLRSATPASGGGGGVPEFSPDEIEDLKRVGNYDWADKLKAMGLEGEGRDWSVVNGGSRFAVDHDDLVKILKGDVRPQDLIF